MSDLTKEQDSDLKIVRDAIEVLRTHFDAVHIFATRHDESIKATIRVCDGEGDFFSRFGIIELWLREQTLNSKED